jgi:hypothetical protein
MKPVKNLVFAALLVFSIALNTLGGDIDLPGAPAPTPQPPRVTATTDETIPGTSTDSQETTVETADYLFLEVLTALLSVY